VEGWRVTGSNRDNYPAKPEQKTQPAARTEDRSRTGSSRESEMMKTRSAIAKIADQIAKKFADIEVKKTESLKLRAKSREASVVILSADGERGSTDYQ